MTETDYAAIVHRYARNAANNKGKKFGKWLKLAGQRHIEDHKQSRKKAFPYVFEPWYANDVCSFIEKLPHVRVVSAAHMFRNGLSVYVSVADSGRRDGPEKPR